MKAVCAFYGMVTTVSLLLLAAGLAYSQDTMDRPPDSLQLWSSVVSVNELALPPKAKKELEKGRKLLLNDRPSDSVSFFRRAIWIAPSYSRAYLLLGVASLDVTNWSEAEASLRKAIELNDKLGVAYLALGYCLVQEQKFKEAERPLLEGLLRNPEISEAHYDLGRTYYALGRFQEAEGYAQKAVELSPDSPNGHLLLGNVTLHLGNAAEALAQYGEYLRLAPGGPFAGATRNLVHRLELVTISRGGPDVTNGHR
jgi:tetratricopeptide (TPR) repeat protein